jgi:protein SCO1/2
MKSPETALRWPTWTIALLLGLGCGARSHAESTLPAVLQGVGFDQRLNEQVPLDLTFRDEQGRAVQLSDFFHGRPVILVLAYYRCPMLCTLVLNGLAQGMLDMPFDAGKEYEVVTVSFDARETPAQAAAKKRTYVERYGRPGAEAGWHFLTGDEASIAALTRAVGFRFVYDAKRDEFAHASGILVLTPAGRISRYFYDVKYPGRDLRLGLVEASAGKIGTPIDQVLLFCFHYDPAAGKYGPAVMRFVRIGGVLTLVLLVAFLALLFRGERRRRVAQDPALSLAAASMAETLVEDRPGSEPSHHA